MIHVNMLFKKVLTNKWLLPFPLHCTAFNLCFDCILLVIQSVCVTKWHHFFCSALLFQLLGQIGWVLSYKSHIIKYANKIIITCENNKLKQRFVLLLAPTNRHPHQDPGQLPGLIQGLIQGRQVWTKRNLFNAQLFPLIKFMFCTGYFVMVPLNLTCLHCLQHLFHLYNGIFRSYQNSETLTFLKKYMPQTQKSMFSAKA